MDDAVRYQVFVSSTYLDLREEREEVIKALLELDCIPAGMELFPASNEERWELIQRVNDDCDYYVVIIGGRYGSMDEKGISYTEREYDYASARGIPVLGFVHADPDKIELGKSELSEEAQQKLSAFRDKVSDRMCKTWTTPLDLGGAVSRSLIQQMKRQPGVGWVRGDRAVTPDLMQELSDLRAHNAQLSSELARPRTEPPAGSEELAQGDDLVELTYDLRRFGQSLTSGVWHYSWNQILGLIGPLMFDEASEEHLRRRLDGDLEQVLLGNPDVAEMLQSFDYSSVSLSPESFHAVKVQLVALGVIEKSVRKRGVKDANTYWRLTPYGESLVFGLSAIRKGEMRPAWRAGDSDSVEQD